MAAHKLQMCEVPPKFQAVHLSDPHCCVKTSRQLQLRCGWALRAQFLAPQMRIFRYGTDTRLRPSTESARIMGRKIRPADVHAQELQGKLPPALAMIFRHQAVQPLTAERRLGIVG